MADLYIIIDDLSAKIKKTIPVHNQLTSSIKKAKIVETFELCKEIFVFISSID